MAGRPTKYSKDYCELATNYCLLGATDDELAEFFGVALSTINKWKLDHPSFSKAIKEGKDIADAKVAQSLYHRATGYSHPETKIATHEGLITDTQEFTKYYPPDTQAALAWLRNRRGNDWKDKKEISGPNGGPIEQKVITANMDAKEASRIYEDWLKGEGG